MKRPLTIAALAAGLIALAAATTLFFLGAYSGRSWSDPASARCDAPPVTFGAKRVLSDRQEVEVHFTCAGAALAGTLTLPKGAGPHPALVWVHGSGDGGRLTYHGAPLVRTLVRSGLAVLSYDKRGVGESQGVCCPGDDDHFNLLAADVVGAVNALRSRPDIDRKQIGLLGASQAGWIVPVAVARSHHRVAFTALVDAPTTTTGEERLYSRLAGEDKPGTLSPQKKVEIARRLKPSGFDPAPFLKQMTVPGLWLYGGQDKSIPAEKSAAILDELRKTQAKDFTVRVFPNAGHGLLDVPPTDPKALPAIVAWILTRVHVPSR